MFDWLYVLSNIDVFIMAFNSTMVDLGSSILKNPNVIRFPSLSVPILYAIFGLSWLVINSDLVNITDFIPWNFKDFILTESRLLFLSPQLCTRTSSSLCISCICLGC